MVEGDPRGLPGNKIAYQGAPGAFGHEACLAFASGHEPVACGSFADVAAAVAAGEVELGMLPVENSRAGRVPGVAELIAGWGERFPGESRGPESAPPRPLPGKFHGLVVVAEHVLRVRLHLLALPGVALGDVRTAVSHPMALRQCARNLAELGLALEEAQNTAAAARDLAGRDRAALASAAAAEIYGLSVVRGDMQDDPNNRTRFAVVRR